MCETSSQTWLVTLLTLWLLLSVARQAFDLIGKLWIPVAFNLLQVLACISGLFAGCQRRLSLLIALTVSCVLSVAYNVLTILWYSGYFGDPSRPVLSAGLPYSYSFFLRHTPICNSHFNLTSQRWVQDPCVLPYYNLESLQALLHIFLALGSMCLAIAVAIERRRQGQKRYSGRSTSSSAKSSNIAAAVYVSGGDGLLSKVGASTTTSQSKLTVVPPPDSINDASSGYMNSSYESPEILLQAPKPTKRLGGAFERYSARKTRSSRTNAALVKPGTPRGLEEQNYSSAATVHAEESAASSSSAETGPYGSGQPFPRGLSERNTSSGGIYLRNGSKPSGASTKRRSEYARMPGHVDADTADAFYSQPQQRPSSARNVLGNVANGSERLSMRAPSAAAAETPDEQMEEGYTEYRRSERRGSNNNLTSLISFDPKSNTLLRVREHHNDASEDEYTADGSDDLPPPPVGNTQRSESQDSVPSIQAPVLSTNPRLYQHERSLTDSGHPSTSSHSGASPDWAQAGITHRPSPVPSAKGQNRIIGYDPAICDPEPPRPSNHAYADVCRPSTSSTAFPAQHRREPSYAGISLSTTIPLAKNALSPQPDRPAVSTTGGTSAQQQHSTHFSHQKPPGTDDQRLMAYGNISASTTVGTERPRAYVNPQTYPNKDDNGLLV
ncbi:Protein T13H5.6 [Aphelenchoides avenae]|nr:Protein T13H5.6 [Aphelenchus avenae]